MREAFMPMMEKCMHFTIHAGETEDVSSIWDILLLIRNGFKAAFSARRLRQEMLREAESEILKLIQEGLPL